MTDVAPFHTNSTDYEPEELRRYHDQGECGYAQRIKRDGNDVAGSAGRTLCGRCADLSMRVNG